MPIILSPTKCLNNQNISPLPTHGLCHCGQFQIPVVSSCVILGGVAVKTRASSCRDCTFSCVLFKTRRPYAVEVEVSTIFCASGPSFFVYGALQGMGQKGVISSKSRRILFKSKIFFLEKIHTNLSRHKKTLVEFKNSNKHYGLGSKSKNSLSCLALIYYTHLFL